VLLAAFALFGGGVWTGRRMASPPAASIPGNNVVAASIARPEAESPRPGSTNQSVLWTEAEMRRRLEEFRNPVFGSTRRSRESSRFVDEIPASAIPLAMKILDADVTREFSTVRTQVLERWASEDLPAALAYAQKLDRMSLRHNSVQIVARVWADQDPRAAMTWAKGLTDRGLAQRVMSSIIGEFALRFPQETMAWLQEPGSPGGRWLHVSQAFRGMADKDPAAALPYFDQLTNFRDRQSAAQAIASRWGERDPFAALEWAKNLQPPRLRQETLSSVFNSWPRETLSQAAALAMGLPSGAIREAAISSVAGNWAQKDIQGAVAWAQSLSDPQTRDTAMSQLSHRWAQEDATAALNCARKCCSRHSARCASRTLTKLGKPL
jgi:hypothetical protein